MGKISKLPKWQQQLIEQPLHALIGFAPVAIVAAHPSWWTGALAGLIIGVVREFEQRPVNRWWDTIIDALFVVVGGALGGLLG